MREFFDVALIGGGPAAVFAAYEFSLKYPELKVVILEEGHPIEAPVRFRTANIILQRSLAAG